MRIAFYAPLKAPDHPVPSGDRRVARLLMQALRTGGHEVDLACRLRSFDPGDLVRQARLERLGGRAAAALVRRWRRTRRVPDLWFTYHLFHKAPDHLGPAVSAAFAIPYVVAEASFAPKRAGGAWAGGHRAVGAAIGAADLVLAMAERDKACVAPLMTPPSELRHLPPFLDTRPFRRAAAGRPAQRRALAGRFGLDARAPWLITIAMMRAGDKLASYRHLARSLSRLQDRPWTLLIAGDGPALLEVRALFRSFGDRRIRWLGRVGEDELADLLAAGDLFVWPGVNEAYGMAFLEAQAAGLPVIACAQAGVPEVVRDGEGGRLVPPDDPPAFASAVADLLDAPRLRADQGRRASERIEALHGIEGAALRLDDALAAARAIHGRRVALGA